MTPQVLIYSRDPDFILVFGHILRAGGFEPLIISSKDDLPRGDALAFAAVLDCQVGDKNIAAICADLKKEALTKATPIAALVAPNAAAVHLNLIKTGADEIFLRPFAPEKLLVWLQAKSAAGKSARIAQSGDLAYGDFVLEQRSHRIRFRGQYIAAPPIEFNLLRSLMARPGTVLSREWLIESAWPDHAGETDIRAVDVHVARLRKRLKTAIGRDVIRTVRSAGYAFAPDW